jgi:hypothetical protein
MRLQTNKSDTCVFACILQFSELVTSEIRALRARRYDKQVVATERRIFFSTRLTVFFLQIQSDIMELHVNLNKQLFRSFTFSTFFFYLK